MSSDSSQHEMNSVIDKNFYKNIYLKIFESKDSDQHEIYSFTDKNFYKNIYLINSS